jgi:O-antigen/teichoic acid export membrane protein
LKQRIRGSYQKLKETNILSNFFNLSSIQISNILLLLLIIRIVTGIVGFVEFGIITLAYRYSTLAGTIINYGTGQSGVRDTAYNLKDTKKLSSVFYNALLIRVFIFSLLLLALFGLSWLHLPYFSYFVLSLPIALAEVFNPLCFFIGTERLRIFNIYNLASNIITVLLLLVFIKSPNEAVWVNFVLGMVNAITYLGLLIYLSSAFKLPFHLPLKHELLKIGKDNFYLTVNNASVNLQQSIILFALPRWGFTAALLGPYSLCDKIIGQCRNLLITISNAIYPNSVHLYKQSTDLWSAYRKKTKYLFAGIFLVGAILIFILADFIVFILSNQHNATAVMILRIMAFVPVLSALNALNVLDQLLKNNTVYLFRISIILFIISLLVALVVLNIGNYLLIGAFTLIIEACALLLFEYIIKKPVIQNA